MRSIFLFSLSRLSLIEDDDDGLGFAREDERFLYWYGFDEHGRRRRIRRMRETRNDSKIARDGKRGHWRQWQWQWQWWSSMKMVVTRLVG
ncbi:hypothetical protein HYC85_027281 [Camellia sinensis]|uniref:Uncharacterized protein n=1 Tax=Camellia sinensis TaxID=4442 RepID=A0A7J7G603_CAMSI|nr:hypothetical protein HYC85_027281 [Camellia sinensis]